MKKKIDFNILIRVDANPNIGFGHLNRCIILAQKMISRHQKVVLARKDPEILKQNLSKSDVYQVEEKVLFKNWPDAECCIVDLYQFDDNYYQDLKRKYKRIVIFDDYMFYAPKGVDCIINANLYGSEDRYNRKNIKFFTGPKYVMVRKEFSDIKKSDRSESIFLCTGGSDPENQTIRILEILLQITRRPVNVVLGPCYEQHIAIEKYRKHKRVHLFFDPPNIGELMADSAYAVTGAGTMMYELAYLGIPTACISLADNQKLNAESFQDLDAAMHIGFCQNINDQKISAQLHQFDKNADYRERIGNNASSLIDGKGAERLASDLINWLQLKN